MKATKIVVAAALLSLATAGSALAFHSGGVAECDGCHTMHNSEDGAAMTTTGGLTQFNAGPYLLQGATQSEACLNCHQKTGDTGPSSYHISTADANMAGNAPLQRTPGGDFGWLRKDIPFSVRGTANVNKGAARGHNIVAPAFGYNADAEYATAPGGAFDATKLQCSSCHDPHGKYRRLADGTIADGTITSLPIANSGSYNNSASPIANVYAVGVYRILGGAGYAPKSYNGGAAFTAGPPAAVAPSTYNRSEGTTETRVAYGQGMSEWCANCHGQIIDATFQSGVINHRHPAGNSASAKLSNSGIATNYNAYVTSGKLNGAQATSYSSLVPYEEGHSNYDNLKLNAVNNGSKKQGPSTGNEQVSCLSCHRAHASGFSFMLRYAHANEFMTIGDSAGVASYDGSTTEGKINQGLTATEQAAAYYDRPASAFGPYARLQCNKCHAKD